MPRCIAVLLCALAAALAGAVPAGAQTAVPAAPANVAPPTLSGDPVDGGTLTVDPGRWTGEPAPTYTIRWTRCDAWGLSCVRRSEGPALGYALTSGDVGRRLRATVTARNASGSRSVTTALTDVVAPAPPSATADGPAVAGTARDGLILTARPGTWRGTGPLTHTFRWQRCAADGAACTDLPGATAATLALAPADIGHTVRVLVTAANAVGSAAAASPPSGVVTPAPPVAGAPPALAGSARETEVLRVVTGAWTGTAPLAHAVQWQRCAPGGAACADVAGATAREHTLTAADVGHTLRAVVTARNAAGAGASVSAPSAVVAVTPPTRRRAPAVTGTAREGDELTVDPGGWTGTGPIAFALQWERCDADGARCLDLPGQTGPVRRLTLLDVGARLRAVVTVTSPAGRVVEASAPSERVAPGPAVPFGPSSGAAPGPLPPLPTPAAAAAPARPASASDAAGAGGAGGAAPRCATASRALRLPGAGTFTVRLTRAATTAAAGRSAGATRLTARLQGPAARLRGVRWTLDGRRLKGGARGVALPAGRHRTLSATLVPRRGGARRLAVALPAGCR